MIFFLFLLHEICIWYNSKIELNIWYRNLCLQLQRSDVSCSSWPVLHTLQQGFWPTPPYIVSRSFIFWSCRWATQSFSSLYRFSIGFRSGDWLGHSRNLKFFLRSHSLGALAVCLGSLSCWKTQPWPIFNALTEGRRLLARDISRYPMYLAIHGTIHPPLNTVQSSSPLCRKSTPKAWCFHPHASRLGWCSWDCTHPSSKHWSGVYTKKLYFGLIWPHDLLPCLLWIIQMVFGKLQTGLD